MKKYIFFLLLTLSFSLFSQEEVPELITDRPDQTESSSTVPLKTLQIESGFVMGNNESVIFKQRSYTYNTTLLRYGLFDNFELRLGMEVLGERTKIGSLPEGNIGPGTGPLYTGFKVKIRDEHSWIPEIAFLGAYVLPFTASNDFKPSYPAANMRFAFAHTLSDRFSLGYNLGAEWDGESEIPNYFYSLALGIGFSDKIGMFIESYGLLREKDNTEHMLDAGFTYSLTSNFQLDVSGGLGLNEAALDNFISCGLSIRLPR